MPNPDQIVIPFSKQKIFRLLWTVISMCLLGALFVVLWNFVLYKPTDTISYQGLIIQVSGWLVIIFFGGLGLFMLSQLYSGQPGLIIDRNGITDNTSELSAGFIPWSNIKLVAGFSAGLNTCFKVFLKDPSEYLSKGNAFARLVKKVNVRKDGPHIILRTNKLDMEHSELLAKIEEYCPPDEALFEAGE